MGKLKFAMVCSSNQNRSMEAHKLLKENGFQVESFGVGNRVKLPGSTARDPNVYEFGTPYAVMYKDLKQKDEEYYGRKGLLRMLERNMKVKEAPERWQNCKGVFDVALTFEERVMDQLVDDMSSRPQSLMKALLVVNIDVVDNHEEAATAAPLTLRLCQMIEEVDEWEDEVDDIINKFEQETGRRLVYTICFY